MLLLHGEVILFERLLNLLGVLVLLALILLRVGRGRAGEAELSGGRRV